MERQAHQVILAQWHNFYTVGEFVVTRTCVHIHADQLL